MDTGICEKPTDEYRLVTSNFNPDSGWTYIPVDDRVSPSLYEGKKATEAYLAEISLELPAL
jgi:hypothetical protein